jgi:hypothetical protein
VYTSRDGSPNQRSTGRPMLSDLSNDRRGDLPEVLSTQPRLLIKQHNIEPVLG